MIGYFLRAYLIINAVILNLTTFLLFEARELGQLLKI